MKILIINRHLSDTIAGSEIQCDLIARGLSARKHQVVYAAVGKCRKSVYSDYPYRIFPLAVEKKGELARLLHCEKPDLVYWRYNRNHLLKSVQACRLAGIPFLFAISSLDDAALLPQKCLRFPPGIKAGIKYLLSEAIGRLHNIWQYRAFKMVSAVTSLNRQCLYKLPVVRQKLIRDSVTEQLVPFVWEKPYCVWVANLKPCKQPELYMDLAQKAFKTCPETDFIMIGRIQNEIYRPMVELAQKNDNFHYLGIKSPEEVNGVLAGAICLVSTCKPEGFGNNYIQAWMQKCPTVSLEFDPDGLIVENDAGLLSGNCDRLLQDVELLVKNAELRHRIAKNAHRLAVENFRQERMLNELESFCTEVVSQHRKSI